MSIHFNRIRNIFTILDVLPQDKQIKCQNIANILFFLSQPDVTVPRNCVPHSGDECLVTYDIKETLVQNFILLAPKV